MRQRRQGSVSTGTANGVITRCLVKRYTAVERDRRMIGCATRHEADLANVVFIAPVGVVDKQ